MRQGKRFLNLAIMCLLSISVASASPITVTFSGTIDSNIGSSGPLDVPGFLIGESFFGDYVFESTTPSDPSATQFGGVPPGRYLYPGAVLSFSVTSGGSTVTLLQQNNDQDGILVDHDGMVGNGAMDNYFVILDSGGVQLYIDLESVNPTLFASGALPLTLPPVSAFETSSIFRIITPGSFGPGIAEGNLDNITVGTPEASTWILGAVGLLILRLMRTLDARTIMH